MHKVAPEKLVVQAMQEAVRSRTGPQEGSTTTSSPARFTDLVSRQARPPVTQEEEVQEQVVSSSGGLSVSISSEDAQAQALRAIEESMQAMSTHLAVLKKGSAP